MATARTPSPVASIHPIGAAYGPRRRRSWRRSHRVAAARGRPPTAGVGCRRAASDIRAAPDRASAGRISPRIGVSRCWTCGSFRSVGRDGTCSAAQHGVRASRMDSTTSRCSSRSLVDASSARPRARSSASVRPRRTVPATAWVRSRPCRTRTSVSGVAPRNTPSGSAAAKQTAPGWVPVRRRRVAIGSNSRPGPASKIAARAGTTLSSSPRRIAAFAASTRCTHSRALSTKGRRGVRAPESGVGDVAAAVGPGRNTWAPASKSNTRNARGGGPGGCSRSLEQSSVTSAKGSPAPSIQTRWDRMEARDSASFGSCHANHGVGSAPESGSSGQGLFSRGRWYLFKNM